MPSMVGWTERLTEVNIGYLVSEGRNFHSIYSMEVLHMFVCPGKSYIASYLKRKKKTFHLLLADNCIPLFKQRPGLTFEPGLLYTVWGMELVTVEQMNE